MPAHGDAAEAHQLDAVFRAAGAALVVSAFGLVLADVTGAERLALVALVSLPIVPYWLLLALDFRGWAASISRTMIRRGKPAGRLQIALWWPYTSSRRVRLMGAVIAVVSTLWVVQAFEAL